MNFKVVCTEKLFVNTKSVKLNDFILAAEKQFNSDVFEFLIY